MAVGCQIVAICTPSRSPHELGEASMNDGCQVAAFHLPSAFSTGPGAFAVGGVERRDRGGSGSAYP